MRNVVISKASTLQKLEDSLNVLFDKGYHIQGGISFQDGLYIAVVVKPF
uniref:Uncharacterized protein n=1 Tax=Salmonella phage vB_SEnST11_KE22 TaxID=3161173 RepID=A0AAU8GFP0_9CAUD